MMSTSSDKLRVSKLNEKGIEEFREYLRVLRGCPAADPPYHLLTDSSTAAPMESEASVEKRAFVSKYEAACYLGQALAPLGNMQVVGNAGLWTWLSLFFFDELCPPRADGERQVKESAKYVLEVGDWQVERRHLLAMPHSIRRQHGDYCRVLLCEPLPQLGDLYEQLTARGPIIRNQELIRLAYDLYYDEQAQRLKSGAGGRRRGGVPRRFVTVVEQLQMTYDLFGMKADEIATLLPTEFGRWLQH